MTAHHHERQICRCGAIIMQCRCVAPKMDRVVCEACPNCQRATTAAPVSTASATPPVEPPTFKSTLRALYDRRSSLFTAARLEALTAEGAAEVASIEAQIDVLELAEAIVQGTFDRAAEAERKFRDAADGLLEATRAHGKAISGASMAALEAKVAGLPAKTAPQDSTPQGTAGAGDATAIDLSECPSEHCPMCCGKACNRCGADDWDCVHDTDERHGYLEADVTATTGPTAAGGKGRDVVGADSELPSAAPVVTFEIPTAAVEWLRTEERGISSEAIFTKMTGLPIGTWPEVACAPSDPSDLRRCRVLLEYAPEWAARLSEMADVSRQWASLLPHWRNLCALMDEEAPHWRDADRDERAPKTYALMQGLLNGTIKANAHASPVVPRYEPEGEGGLP